MESLLSPGLPVFPMTETMVDRFVTVGQGTSIVGSNADKGASGEV
jgi:hypothetical protein